MKYLLLLLCSASSSFAYEIVSSKKILISIPNATDCSGIDSERNTALDKFEKEHSQITQVQIDECKVNQPTYRVPGGASQAVTILYRH